MSLLHSILGFLRHRPMHGYEIKNAFETVIGGPDWELSTGKVYNTLDRLEESGWVARQNPEAETTERKVYELTAEGREELVRWLLSPVSRQYRLRDEFYVKLIISLIAEDTLPARVIQEQRKYLFQELHTLTSERDRIRPARDLPRLLLLDSAMMHLEADLRWLDMCEARLEELRSQPWHLPESRPRGRPRKSDEGGSATDRKSPAIPRPGLHR